MNIISERGSFKSLNKCGTVGVIVKNPDMKYDVDVLMPVTECQSFPTIVQIMNEAEAIKNIIKTDINGLKGIVMGLSGTLGAGKTHFVKNLLKTVDSGFTNQVQSPTFNICNVYTSDLIDVHHYDLYRIESEDELYEIEIWESIVNSNVLTCIEWVDRFPELYQSCSFTIHISICEDDRRNYNIEIMNY